MKKILCFLITIPFLSCSAETNRPAVSEIFGEWVLVKTWGQFPGSEQYGEEKPFQETYYLNEDGTFLKVRLMDGEELEATGTYDISETGSTIDHDGAGVFLEMQYEVENPLIASCSSLIEYLYLTKYGKLRSTHEACDGLGLLYQKVN